MTTILQDIQHDVADRGIMEDAITDEHQAFLKELDMQNADRGDQQQFKLNVPRAKKTTAVMPGDIVMIDAGEGAKRAYIVTTGADKNGKAEITWMRTGKKHPAPIDVKDLKMGAPSQHTRAQTLGKANPQAAIDPATGESKANIYYYTKQFSFMHI